MSKHLILNWCMATAVVAGWLTLAAHFDQQRFEGDQRHNADKKVQQRKQAAANKICGLNGAPHWVDNNTLECAFNTALGVSK